MGRIVWAGTTPPFVYSASPAGAASCSAWMRAQCAVPANESTQVYPRAYPTLEAGRMVVAAFLVSRGPFSYLGAQTDIINAGDWSDPLFRLHRLDTGRPLGDCTEEKAGVPTLFNAPHNRVCIRILALSIQMPTTVSVMIVRQSFSERGPYRSRCSLVCGAAERQWSTAVRPTRLWTSRHCRECERIVLV
jgi:hypothetical protein